MFDFGTSEKNCLVLALDAGGALQLTGAVGGREAVSVKGRTAVPVGTWARLRVEALDRSGEPLAFEVAGVSAGFGMNEETLRTFLDPFYTTKFAGRGVGMAAVQLLLDRGCEVVARTSAPHRDLIAGKPPQSVVPSDSRQDQQRQLAGVVTARQLQETIDLVLQIPAFLCRQTDLVVACAATGKPVNIKKGQFLSPWEMKNVIDKARSTGNEQIMVCERGVSFGYNNLVSDMRSLAVMRSTGAPVVFDATHSVQLPGGKGSASGGQREFVPVLARAAVAAGISGLFMETHPDPAKALSDGPNAWPLDRVESLLATLMEIDQTVKSRPFEESVLES